MPTLLPPKRIVAAVAPTAAAEPAPAPAPEPAAEQAAAPAAPAAPPAALTLPKKAAPVKTPKAAKPPAAKSAPKKAAPKRAPPKKAAPKKALPKKAPVRSSPRAATENVVPKVLKIKTRIWSDEAVELGTIIVDMKKVVPAITKERIELRSVSDRLQVMFNEKLGIPCHKVYSTLADVAKIVKLLQRVPEKLLPAKWPLAFERIEKHVAKHGA